MSTSTQTVGWVDRLPKTLRSIIGMLGGRGANVISGLILTLAISRYLGPAGFGVFTFLNTIVITGGVLANFGLDTWMVREISYHPEKGDDTLATVLGLKLWGSLIIILPLILFDIVPVDAESRVPLALFSLVIYFNARLQTLWHFADAKGEFRYHSTLWAITNGLRALFGVIALALHSDLFWLVSALVVAESAGYLISKIWIEKKLGLIRVHWFPENFLEMVRKAAPFAGLSALSVISFRLDILMMSWMTTNEAVGWYATANKFVELYTIVPVSIFFVLFPKFARQFKEGPEAFKAAIQKALLPLLGLGIVAATVLYLLSSPLILLLFGDAYTPAIPVLNILSIALFFVTINYLLSYILFSSGFEKANCICLVILTVVNFSLNWLWIPKYGGIGTAWGTVVSELVYMISMIPFVLKSVRQAEKVTEEESLQEPLPVNEQ